MACPLAVSDYKTRLGKLLDDPNLVHFTAAEVIHALNVGQRLWAFLTLCIEREAGLTLTNGQAAYQISAQIADFIVPLRVYESGRRLRPESFHALDARDATWRNRAGDPDRYATLGFDRLFVTPQTASGIHALDVWYAAWPAELALNTDEPEIAAENHPDLEDFAYYFLRLKDGGQEGQNAAEYLQRFLAAAQKHAGFVRARGRAQRYDVAPPADLFTMDLSNFEWIIKATKKPEAKAA